MVPLRCCTFNCRGWENGKLSLQNYINSLDSSTHISDIHAVHSASITSDHFPLFFNITVSCKLVPHIRSPTVCRPPRTAWSKVSSADIDHYSHLVSCSITTLPSQIYSCVTPNCTEHNHSLDTYARNFLSTLLDCARQCFPQHSSSPRRLVCWNYTSCSKLKQTAHFWYRLWEDAGHPSSGVRKTQQPDTSMKFVSCPVLFMELIDESLTSFLERPPNPPPLPLHVQLDIAHDVSQALSHLHRHEMLHVLLNPHFVSCELLEVLTSIRSWKS